VVELSWPTIYLGLVAFVTAALTVGAARSAVRNAPSWGVLPREPVAAGEGPFRRARTSEEKERGVPTVVWLASLPAIVWGIVTLAILAPVGALLVLSALESGHDRSMATFAAFAIGSVVAAAALLVSGCALLRCESDVPRVARIGASVSILHHTGVAAICLVPGMHEAAAFAIPIALVGLVHAAITVRAATVVESLAR
jgi:hypothetical protein